MLSTLVMIVAVVGSDPSIVFAGDGTYQSRPRSEKVDSRTQSLIETPFASLLDGNAIFRPNVVRGQSGAYNTSVPFEESHPNDPNHLDMGAELQDDSIWKNPFVKEFLEAMDPFAPAEFSTLPNYYDPFGSQMGTGTKGPPGYRLGWVSYNDTTVLSGFGRSNSNSLNTVEWNSNIKYSALLAPGILFNATGYFNAHWWSGPTVVSLPAQVDQISIDLELGLFGDGPWSGQIAFHPQIVETYEKKIDRSAINLDGRAIAMYKASPEWSFVGGVAIWDRVTTMIVPHVGAIWTPNNRWEFRVLYPKSRISYLLGNRWNADFWLYGQAEYSAESWKSVDSESPNVDRIQITDDRLSLGIRWDSGRYSTFVEGGYVFNRRIKFDGTVPGIDLTDAVMFRAGLRY